jgi:hypothetical protein
MQDLGVDGGRDRFAYNFIGGNAEKCVNVLRGPHDGPVARHGKQKSNGLDRAKEMNRLTVTTQEIDVRRRRGWHYSHSR